MKSVIIYSGGIDSTALLYQALKDGEVVYALGFDYGQKHVKELQIAKETCRKLGVPFKLINLHGLNELASCSLTRDSINIPNGNDSLEAQNCVVVPNRNMVMIALATSYAISLGADYVYIGAHKDDELVFHDCRSEFFNALGEAISLCDGQHIELVAPFINMEKFEIIKKANALGVDFSQTWSCYSGKEKPCGECLTCVERKKAFEKAGIEDPLEVDNAPSKKTN